MDGMSDHRQKTSEFVKQTLKPDLDVDNHPPTAEEREMREYPLALAAVRQKLAGKHGKQYWRTLEELSENPHFGDLLHREFPRAASEWDESVDRRDFLKLMGASLALAGMAGCGGNAEPHIVPYVRQPEGMVLGKPQHYATVMPFGGDALGLLVESHEGRPTKIEGNPDHPSSLGATDVFAQAAVLDLYDPHRAKTTTYMGELDTWERFQTAAVGLATSQKAVNGAGLRILTGTITSPTLAAQIDAVLKLYPQAKCHQWEPAVSDGAREGAKLAFGRVVNTVYRFDKANVVVSLDADFMTSGPGHVRYMRDFYRRRNLTGPNDEMNRLYVVEPTPTVTGAAADNHLPLRSNDVELFARALAAKLGPGGAATPPAGSEKFLDAVASDLLKLRGAGLVIAGEQQSAELHALAHLMNGLLGNAGTTVYYTEPVEANPVNHTESLRDLCSAMTKGKVDLLLILGGNPVYNAPHDWDFVTKMRKVNTIVHLAPDYNETSEHAQWHIPEAHFLEMWGDARAFDGTYSVIQPLIAPLYRAHSAFEVLAAFTDKPGVTALDTIRERMKSMPGGADADKFWRKSLNDGFVAGSAYSPITVSTKLTLAGLPPAKATADMEFLFRPDPTIYDGRFANNGWLQELAKPISKITWDNAALMSPATAEKLGVTHKIMSRGGEHGQVRSAVVDIALSNSKVTAAAWVMPGQADGVVVLPLGYGRMKAGYTGSNKGFNAYAVRVSDALWTASGGKVTVTGDDYPLACTQYHHNVEGRKILSTATLEEYKKNPNFAHEHDETPPRDVTLYKDYEKDYPQLNFYQGYKWAMAIDTTKCNGCNACVVACQSENNIPVVGKDQVMRGREMHWIRIDRYYETGLLTEEDKPEENAALANPPTYFQPVPCQQCENAPCEQVCPVGATVHSAEGLNDMVYNRCVGTRYCSNNCPYKVRRFNFLRFQDWETPSLKLMRNPEVTIRSRGVMEKCTYCVQRINNVRITAEKDGENGASRTIRDGEIVTACEQACPSEAIVFGNANDPNSRVSKLRAPQQQRAYNLLGELNTRPRTTYLGAVRNPHPDLTAAEKKEPA
jgi:molybdopterin-containing oxidoreductase family iron-sulfur binding subunit